MMIKIALKTMQTNTKNIENDTLTFFVWADMHFGYEQKSGLNDIRWQALHQMDHLTGHPYPPETGGYVESPSMILVCGDFVTGGSDGERNFAYYREALRQIDLPSYEVLGNHEVGYPHVIDAIIGRYGNRYYSFDVKGIHFTALYQTFDKDEKVEALDAEQLEWLEKDIASLDKGTPVVLFAHDALCKQSNSEDIYRVISKANAILILSGHTHGRKPADGKLHFYRWHGITGAVTGHVRNHPIDMAYGRTFLVVRITPEQVLAIPWRWDLQEWDPGQVWSVERSEHKDKVS